MLKHVVGKILIAVLPLLLSGCFVTDYFWGDDDEEVNLATPLTEIESSVTLSERFVVSVGSGNDERYLHLYPVVVNDTIYIVDANGELSAINRNTGKHIWERDTDQDITAGVGILDEELLLVGNNLGEVVAYQQEDGDEVWRIEVGSEILAPPVGADSHVIVYAINNSIYGLAAVNGELDWQINNSMPALVLRANSPPLILNDQIVYLGLSNGRVLAFNISTGRRLWEHLVTMPRGRSELQRMVDISGQMALVDDTLYVVTFQGRVAALATATGRERWHRNMSSYTGLNANEDYVTLSDDKDTVWLLSAKNGTTVWQQEALLYRGLSTPTFWRDYLVVGDKEGYIH